MSVTRFTRRVGTRLRIGVRVLYSNGGVAREITSPYQQPAYAAVAVTLRDLDGDGVFDAVVFTARNTQSRKKVSRTIRL
jgi:hypothetical protein